MNKKYFILFLLLIFIFTVFPKDKEKIPGLETMKKYGNKLTPEEIILKIGEILSNMGFSGQIASSAYNESLNEKNENPVFIVEKIEYDENGLAKNIKGHTVIPHTFRDYVIKGGLGTPVYEAAEPNEFGVIFGRKGNIAIRNNVIVRQNPLDESEIYEIYFESEMYDKIMTFGILEKAYELLRTPYLENLIIELEGMLLNSESKKAILESMREFKKKNKRMNDTELMLNFLKANKSYLDIIKNSNKETKKRIKEGEQLLDAIDTACALQAVEIAEIFAEMAEDIASIFTNFSSAAYLIADYVERNVPKNTDMTFEELEEIEKYNNYLLKEYNKNKKKNDKLWKIVKEINKSL